MFTGIVEELGQVAGIVHTKNLAVLMVKTRKILKGTKIGDSVAINGVCLTVTEKKRDCLSFDIMLETLRCTTLGGLAIKDYVNLERALKAGDRLSGHFVTGHVDCISKIYGRVQTKNYTELKFTIPRNLRKYIVPKGSICIDGVSLTVGAVTPDGFSVYLIPFTSNITTLGEKQTGDQVNVEVDILAKYILKK
jgi:riboflavin synthase